MKNWFASFFKPECIYGTPDGPEADYFGLLPDVVIVGILSRLPIQQLQRCSRVCRRWHSLLGTPGFAQEHEKRHRTSQVPLVYSRCKKQEDRGELIFLRDREARKWGKKPLVSLRLDRGLKEKISWPQCALQGTYTGLLLFGGDSRDSTYCILNPLTREAERFTNPDRVCGLYFHPPKGRYRLLCYREIAGTNSFQYYVCSTGQELLKEVGMFEFKPAAVPELKLDIPAVAVKGQLYWLVRGGHDSDRYIMTFDVVSETLKLRPHPKAPCEDDQLELWERWSARLFESGDRLYMYTSAEMGMEVWILEDSTNWGWARAFEFRVSPRDYGRAKCLYWSPLTIEDDEFVFIQPRRGIYRFSAGPNKVRGIGDGSRKDLLLYFSSMVNWRRSLVSFRDYL